MAVSTFCEFDDPDAFHAAIRALRVDGVITGRGQFYAELTRIDFARVWMQRTKENLPHVLHMENAPQRAAVIFVTGQGPSALHVSGLPLRVGEIIAWDSGLSRHHKAACAGGWGSMSLKSADLSMYSEKILGRRLPTPSDPRSIRLREPLARRLLDLHEAAGHLARTTPDLLTNPQVARAFDQALIEAFVSCLAGGEQDEPRGAHRSHVRVLRRLEQVLQANPEQAMYMTELCAAVGASYPTLHACCHEHIGISPKRYLWLRRMHLARRTLRNAAPATTTVTQIATDLGFWELGRFSVTYRSLFGESPSTTLHAPPEPKPREINGSPWEFIKTA
jgi:AraC-like DNA-binding protein